MFIDQSKMSSISTKLAIMSMLNLAWFASEVEAKSIIEDLGSQPVINATIGVGAFCLALGISLILCLGCCNLLRLYMKYAENPSAPLQCALNVVRECCPASLPHDGFSSMNSYQNS